MQIRGNEQRVVVEHLLEVRHEPLLVDRVAVEAAADEVVHAAARHPVERALEPRSSAPRAEQELERRRGRELRRVAEAAPARVELRAQHAHGVGEERVGERLARRTARARCWRSASTSAAPARDRRRAASRYASAIACSTCRNDGIPCRGSGG